MHQWRNTVIINLQLLLPRSFSSAIDSNHAGSITLGQFTLEEVERIKALDSANLKSDSLTCQPRVFSPLGNILVLIPLALYPGPSSYASIKTCMWLANWLNESFSQQIFGRGKQGIRWPGRDSEGEVVARGLYIVTVTVGNQRQNKVANVWNH